jgi:RNA 3'-terminal phosphate cyclase (ATP)
MTADALLIDGAQGEGGGQILRTSLALSAIHNQPIAIEHIRANRDKPGLRPQHLTGVTGMGKLCNATLEGAQKGSSALTFAPTQLPGGTHTIDIGTAGSTSLLLHAIYFAMAWGETGGQLTLHGGTHNDRAPSFDYLQHVWAPMLQQCGYQVSLELTRHGFYPRGGGCIHAEIPGGQQHVQPETPFHWLTRPAIDEITIHGLWAEGNEKRVSKQRSDVPKRMVNAAQDALRDAGYHSRTQTQHSLSHSIGAVCHIFCTMGPLRAGFTAFGRKGVPAEIIGQEAAAEAIAFLESGACIEEHLSDQFLLPLALSGQHP